MKSFATGLVWFRRDLRAFDHAALHYALTQCQRVYCAFVFDRDILDSLPRVDRRVEFIHASVVELDSELRRLGGALIVRHGQAVDVIAELARALQIEAVFANRDYEPQATLRDQRAAQALNAAGCAFLHFKDQLIFEKDEILSQAGTPFSVFTPYRNAWLKKLASPSGESALDAYAIEALASSLAPPPPALSAAIPTLAALGFMRSDLAELAIPTGSAGALALLEDFLARMGRYDQTRDFPALKGPSYLSVHLRFGTLSIRMLAKHAWDAMRAGQGAGGASVWLSELIWRDFYFMILHHHPHVVQQAFKPAYDAIAWESGQKAEQAFAAWCEGRTGYPLVDAAMLQLKRSGYMHNRLRMVTASFLVKNLGIDWRRGEHYFAEKLIDFDLAANNGGWQWAASTGCDAQPYFRIFNPVTQSQKFDADGKFIRRYLPQLARLDNRAIHAPWLAGDTALQDGGVVLGQHYPAPIVMHDEARQRTLARYAVVKQIAAKS